MNMKIFALILLVIGIILIIASAKMTGARAKNRLISIVIAIVLVILGGYLLVNSIMN